MNSQYLKRLASCAVWAAVCFIVVASLRGDDKEPPGDAEPPESFSQLPDYARWRLATCAPDTPAREAIFFRSTEIRQVKSADQFARPTVIEPPKGCNTLYLVVRQGEYLLVTFNSQEGKRFACKKTSDEDSRWRISPPRDGLDSAIIDLAIDSEGRMIATKKVGNPVVYYQETAGGPVKEYRYPVAIESRFSGNNLVRPVVSGGGIWVFEDVVGGATNIRRLDGALQFLDGKIKHFDLPVELHITSAVPVAENLLLVGVMGGNSFFWDSSKGQVVTKGPFDLKPFRFQPVSRWSRAADGSIWMSTFSQYDSPGHEKEQQANRYGQVWRWHKSQLKLVQDGFDGRKGFYLTANPLVAVSAEEAFAGCCSGGFLRVVQDRSQHVDWRHGLSKDFVRQIRVGSDFVLVTGQSQQFEMARRHGPEFAKPYRNKKFVEHRAFHQIVRDPQGQAWTILPSDTARFAFWKEGRWHPTVPTPQGTHELWYIAVDGLGRPWAFHSETEKTTWVYEDKSWRKYANRREAYRDQLARHAPKLKFDFLNHFFNMCPLAVGRDEIWLVGDRGKSLSILRNGKWWTSAFNQVGDRKNRFQSRPFLDAKGAPRIVQGSQLLQFDGKSLVESGQQPPKTSRTPLQRHNEKLTALRKNSRLPQARTVVTWAEADNGIFWAVSSQGEMYGFAEEVVETVSLRGTPLWSRPPRGAVVAADGTLFINTGPGYGNHLDQWISFRFRMPEVKFSAKAKIETNALRVELEELQFPLDQLVVQTRLDQGPWRSTLRFDNVLEGKHKVQVRARLKNRLSTGTTQQLSVQVSGNLREKIATLVKQLGDASFRIRERATNQLMEIGQPAATQLRKVQDSTDSEVRFRARKILDSITSSVEGTNPSRQSSN